MKMRAVAAALLAPAAALALLLAYGPSFRSDRTPFGFSRQSAPGHLRLERQFLRQPDTGRIREMHRLLTSEPHPAGSARTRQIADWMAAELRRYGFDDVAVEPHEVVLPYPVNVTVELLHPDHVRASMRERGAGDPEPGAAPDAYLPGFHAYAASGDVTAEVVYAGEGLTTDYDWLEANGVDVRGRLVLVRHSFPYSYRGAKVWNAEQRGAAGVLVFSDPAVGGRARGRTFPDGPWAPDDAVERGSVAYGFLSGGDPLSPGWASVPGAPRLEREQAHALPRIPSAPLSAADAAPVLEALAGTRAPDAWQGGLPFAYHVGPGPARVRLRVLHDEAVRAVWTVTGRIHGSTAPDEMVIVGNHHDAWIYGGVDPSSGTAALVELARSLGALVTEGWRPKRSILLAGWDAEEFALVSSTEWAEQYQEQLRERAVAYVNVDSAASGRRLAATAVPSLARLVEEAAGAVRDPVSRISLAARARDAGRAEGGRTEGNTGPMVADTRVGGGSDYTVFLNHLGIPIADLGFRGEHGVYHSAYDTHEWVSRFGDPQFSYHAALVQLWGLIVLRLADADALPLDASGTASFIEESLERLALAQPRTREALLQDARTAARELTVAAARFNDARHDALSRGDAAALARANRQILLFERAFLDPEGLAGRPWYRHLLHAPAFTYRPQVLPGIAQAVESDDDAQLAHEVRRLAAAVRRAAARLAP